MNDSSISSVQEQSCEKESKNSTKLLNALERPLSSSPLLEVKNLTKEYKRDGKLIQAVSNVSFDLYPGETLGLVGESGCGKSTIGKCLIRLTEPTSGSIFFAGTSISLLKGPSLQAFRRKVSMIFQDPYASLNPRMTAKDIVGEPLDIHKLAKGSARDQRIEELFQLVGLPLDSLSRFPHEFSGGQRQRIGIARALAARPNLLICDEPISALDVSVQAQVINLLKKLQQQMGLTILFIAHDLRVVKYLSNRVAVMYLGTLVEIAPSEVLYKTPLHPYTQALFSAIPIPDPQIERTRRRTALQGEAPSPYNPPSGCPFVTRCPLATELCKQKRPALKEVSPGHFVACHLVI